MFGTGLIVFRETLEAALFVGIIAAATRGVPHRMRWLWLGMVAGVVGSTVLASTMGEISTWADGIGQDIVAAVILSIALPMLAWHCIWVSSRPSVMVEQAKRMGVSAAQGRQTLWALAIAVALSVLREGAETVLFVAGLSVRANESQAELVLSTLLGLGLGGLLGWLMYAGLGRVKPQRLFVITNTLILLLAGSLASQLAKTVNQAGWVDWLGDRAWDISGVISNDSVLGMLLHGVFGYESSPTQLQLLFYLSSTFLIWASAKQVKSLVNSRRHTTVLAA